MFIDVNTYINLKEFVLMWIKKLKQDLKSLLLYMRSKLVIILPPIISLFFFIFGIYSLTLYVLSSGPLGHPAVIIEKKLYRVSAFTDILVAAGTFALAFVAYLQIMQNKKIREEEVSEKEKKFDETKKSIYKVLISKINVKIPFFSDLINYIEKKHKWSKNRVTTIYDFESIINFLEKEEEFNFLINKSEYFTTKAIDAIISFSTVFNMFINHLKNVLSEPPKNQSKSINPNEIILLKSQYFCAVNNGVYCIILLIEDGELYDNNKHVVKVFLDSLKNTLVKLINSMKELKLKINADSDYKIEEEIKRSNNLIGKIESIKSTNNS